MNQGDAEEGRGPPGPVDRIALQQLRRLTLGTVVLGLQGPVWARVKRFASHQHLPSTWVHNEILCQVLGCYEPIDKEVCLSARLLGALSP